MAALPVLLPPSTPALTLYALEENLESLVDSAELVTVDQEGAFLEDFRHALTAAVEKRDRVAQFIDSAELAHRGLRHPRPDVQGAGRERQVSQARRTDQFLFPARQTVEG